MGKKVGGDEGELRGVMVYPHADAGGQWDFVDTFWCFRRRMGSAKLSIYMPVRMKITSTVQSSG